MAFAPWAAQVSRSARCGACHTCLHPHLKKACLQRRQEQLAKLDASGEIPLLLLPQYQTMTTGRLPNGHAAAGPGVGPGAGPGPAPAAAAAPPPAKRHKARPDYAELDAGGAAPEPDPRPRAKPAAAAAAPAAAPGGDPFSRELQQIVGRRGGLESARFAPRLIRLMGLPGVAGDMRRVLLHIGAIGRPPHAVMKRRSRAQVYQLYFRSDEGWLHFSRDAFAAARHSTILHMGFNCSLRSGPVLQHVLTHICAARSARERAGGAASPGGRRRAGPAGGVAGGCRRRRQGRPGCGGGAQPLTLLGLLQNGSTGAPRSLQRRSVC